MKYILILFFRFILESHQQENININLLIGTYKTTNYIWTLTSRKDANGKEYLLFKRLGGNDSFIFYDWQSFGNNEIKLCRSRNDCYGRYLIFKSLDPTTCKGNHYTKVEFHSDPTNPYEGAFKCQ